MPSEYPELVPLLGEIRDQLKRIANSLQFIENLGIIAKAAMEDLQKNDWVLPVEIGEPTVRVRHKLKDGKWE